MIYEMLRSIFYGKNTECHLLQILLGAKHYLSKCNVNLFRWSAHGLRFLCKKHKQS